MAEPTPDKALERQVVSHYEALGYSVTPDVKVDNHQIDLLASRILDGGMAVNLMIEVKHRLSDPIGVNDVGKFITTAQSLMADMLISNAVMVTDSTYTSGARGKVLGKPAIQLLTLKQLEEDIFSYSSSLLRIANDYADSAEARRYIPLCGMDTAANLPVSNIAAHALAWARENGDLLAIVGDFGSGKTTLLRRIRYEQAQLRVAGINERYPVLLNLRAFRRRSSLWDFILSELRDGQFISPSKLTFDAQLNSGRLLILLDGFDEIETGVTVYDRRLFLEMLSPLLTSPCPCIMTTRATYFETVHELEASILYADARRPKIRNLDGEKVDFDDMLNSFGIGTPPNLSGLPLRNIISISQLGGDGIQRYLENIEPDLISHTGKTATEAHDFLKQLYDLGDLIGRPLLISMVVTTIFKGQLSLDSGLRRLGPAGLYEIYTQASAIRDDNVRSGSLDKNERLTVCEMLAYRMLQKGSIELTAAEVVQALTPGETPLLGIDNFAAKEFLGRDSLGRIDRILSDIRVCTFLAFTDDGGFHFSHKSFYEFFLARAMLYTINTATSGLNDLAKLSVPAEVMYFLSSYTMDNAIFSRIVVDLFAESRRADILTRSLFAKIIFCSPHLLMTNSIKGAYIFDCRLRNQKISGVDIADVHLERVTISGIKATRWRLVSGSCTYFRIEGGSFRESEISLRGNNSAIAGVDFLKGKMNLHGESVISENCRMEEVLLELHGGTQVIESVIESSEISIGLPSIFNDVEPEGDRRSLRLPFGGGKRDDGKQDRRVEAGAVLANCIVGKGTRLLLLPRSSVHLKSCKLLGLCVTAIEFGGIVETNSGYRDSIALEDCSGLLLVIETGGPQLAPVDVEAFQRRFANIIVGMVRSGTPGGAGRDGVIHVPGAYWMETSAVEHVRAEVLKRGLSPDERQEILAVIESMAVS